MQALSETITNSPGVVSITPRLCSTIATQRLPGVRPYEAVVLVRLDEDGEPMVFDGFDVGPTGLFLRSDFLFDEGDEVWMTFPSPKGHPVNARGRVVEVSLGAHHGDDCEAGMRVEFSEISNADWQSLFV